MEMVRHYAFLLQKRYGTNLQLEEDIRNTDGWIAPLSIQLLVENAIKHNVVSADKPLRVTIVVDKVWVSVSNPIQPKISGMQESTGFGLSSLVARYQYLTREKVVIEDHRHTFTVRIPVIHKV
jgi:LytS/YehU family sensor histidine kinase